MKLYGIVKVLCSFVLGICYFGSSSVERFRCGEGSYTMFIYSLLILCHPYRTCRSQCPRGLRRRSAAARLLRLWVRIPPGAWMSVVSVACCATN